jgi:hypothetical protein
MTNTTRRSILAAAPAAALALAVPALAGASSEMAAAIARHRAAWERFVSAVTACDAYAPGYDPSAAEANKLIYDEASDAELEALAELIAVVPANMDEVRMRFAHLLAVDAAGALDYEDLKALFESMA